MFAELKLEALSPADAVNTPLRSYLNSIGTKAVRRINFCFKQNIYEKLIYHNEKLI